MLLNIHKISRSYKSLTVLLCLLAITAVQVVAQSLTIQAPSSIPAGQSFRVKFEADGRAKNFTPPSFKGLSVLSGPNQSSSSSFSMINGKTTSAVSTSFNYVIRADQEGRVTIGPASCVIDGKKVSSQSFTIQVTKADPNANRSQSRSNNNSGAQQQPATATTIDNNTLFARASVSKSNPYQGEEVIITYKIYTQVSLQQYQIDKLPGNKGFWSEDLSEGKSIQLSQENVNGRNYQVAEIRRGALYAQETGQLTIEPLKLDVLAVVPVQRRRTGTIWDLFDDPFFNQGQAVKKSLTTNGIKIKVKPLPTPPDNYYGGVGNFQVKSSIDHTEVKANEAITYTITISGRGNLSLLEAPQLTFPKVFEVYEPKITDNIVRGDNGLSGSRTFEWVLIPQNQGDYVIPAFTYTYFVPQKGAYASATTQEYHVKVAKGDKSSATVSTGHDVKLLNNDINHIKSSVGHLRQQGSGSGVTPLQWILLGVIILLVAIIIFVGRRHQAQESDVQGSRRRHALKKAQRRLQTAQHYLASGANDEKFYEEIYKALWGCLSDKYTIELSQLSRDSVQSTLEAKGIAQDKLDLIMKTLNDVDMARFAPGDSSAHKQSIYQETLETIASLV